MITKSKAQTQKLAASFAMRLLKAGPRNSGATVVALHGDLGAGKTTFTQGFIKALGVTHHVTSPTFLIVRRYGLESRKFLNAYHFDLYRIHDPKEILALDFKKIISTPENIVLIEWPERIGKSLPKNSMRINFEHGKNEKERKIKIMNDE